MDELNKTGEVCFGPLAARSFEGFKDYDKYYIDVTIKQVVKKTGDGEDDYILVDKEIITKRDIAKTINAQASDVGIEAYLKNYEITGEPMPDVVVGDEIQDFTDMPNNLAEAALLGEKSRKLFDSLPSDIKGKMGYEEFISSFTQEMFDSFLAKLSPKVEEKKEGNE